MDNLKHIEDPSKTYKKRIEGLIEIPGIKQVKEETLKKNKESESLKAEINKNLADGRKLVSVIKKLRNKTAKVYSDNIEQYRQNKIYLEKSYQAKLSYSDKLFIKQKKAIIILSILLVVFSIVTFSLIGPASRNIKYADYINRISALTGENNNLKTENQTLTTAKQDLQIQLDNLAKEYDNLKTPETTSAETVVATTEKTVKSNPYLSSIANIVKEYKLLINHIETYGNITDPDEKIAFENSFLAKLVEIDNILKSINVPGEYKNDQQFFITKSSQMIQFVGSEIEYLKSKDYPNSETMIKNFYSTYHDFVEYYNKLKN